MNTVKVIASTVVITSVILCVLMLLVVKMYNSSCGVKTAMQCEMEQLGKVIFSVKHILPPNLTKNGYSNEIRIRMKLICEDDEAKTRKENTFFVAGKKELKELFSEKLNKNNCKAYPNCYCSEKRLHIFHLHVTCDNKNDQYQIKQEGHCKVVVTKFNGYVGHLDGVDWMNCEEKFEEPSFYNQKCTKMQPKAEL